MADIALMKGVPELQARTLGDPAITIALLDGPADLDHACFDGADVSLADPQGLLDHPVESWASEHATHIASVLFGQPDSEVPGMAPRCRGLVVVAGTTEASLMDEAVLAGAVEYAVDAGVDIIHCAFCVPSQSGTSGSRLLARAFERAREAGIPVVSPVGNDSGTAWCLPATSPHTLAVGSVDDDGVPAPSTNHGQAYLGHAVMANGTRILGAAPGGGTIRMRGTSCAAPIASGVLALLLSALRETGSIATAFDAARAIVAAARPYEGTDEDAQRCVGGVLDPMAALAMLESGDVPAPAGRQTVSIRPPDDIVTGSRAARTEEALPPRSPIRWEPGAPALLEPEGAEQSLRLPARVFAIGRVDVDFGSSGHRDRLARLMADDGEQVPPEDPAALVRLVRRYPAEAAHLVWLLVREDGEPMYALRPEGPFAEDLWSLLIEAYEAFHTPGGPQHVSIPGIQVADMAATASGSELPVVLMPVVRGVYAWTTRDLAESAAAAFGSPPDLITALEGLLARGYNETAGAGATAPERALQYSLTNAMAVAWSLAQVRDSGRHLTSLSVRRSRFTRPHSDCWDLILTFDDPQDEFRARELHRHTVDVADIVPVSVGQPQRWFEPG